MKLRLFIFTAMIFSLLSCQQQSQESQEAQTEKENTPEPQLDMSNYPELLQKALKAHGGLKTWRDYARLEYVKQDAGGSSEKHITNLNNRKILIDRDTVKLGFDGNQVWVSPGLASFAGPTPRFYHNLHFYFFSIPFVLADPGAIYEDLGESNIDGETYRSLKVTYESGVGDTPDDIYIAHFDPDSFQLRLALYTVTYFDESSEKFNALHYEEWQKSDGLLVPKVYKGYVFNSQDSTLGKQRYMARFENIDFSMESPPESLFAMPEVAEIDSLKSE